MPKILVVEDTADTREIVARLLRLDGYETICAGNGREALDAVQEDIPDLILLDVMMPEMDGLTFLSHLRDHPAWKNLPVIMMTARFDDDSIRRARELGVKEYLVKARFTADEMLQHVHRQVPPC